MLRLPIVSAVNRSRLLAYALPRSAARAHFVTAAQKRALNEKQLAGKDVAAAEPHNIPPESSTPSIEATLASTVANKVGGESTKSNGGSIVLPLTALLAAATGAAYYMEILPGFAKPSPAENIKKEKIVVTPPVLSVETNKEAIKATEIAAPVVNPEKTEKKKKPKGTTATSEEIALNRVVNIQSFTPSSDEIERRNLEHSLLSDIPQHDPDGHRVTVTLLPTLPNTVPLDSTLKSMETTNETTPTLAEHAMTELGLDRENIITVDETLKRAHALLRGSLDESFLVDLETLSPAQLRIRVVQLVSEMAERTKWEAVRLKEFLALKEREVTDR